VWEEWVAFLPILSAAIAKSSATNGIVHSNILYLRNPKSVITNVHCLVHFTKQRTEHTIEYR
jgi:hypothetical protein